MQNEIVIEPTTTKSRIARLPFYYGWIILAVGAIGVLASIPGQTMGVSVFTDHIIEALNISRVSVSTAYMIGTLSSSLIIPFAGIFLDRRGVRLTGSLATVGLSISLLFLATSVFIVNSLNSFLPLPETVLAFIVVTIGFLGIRFFGQGVISIVSRTMVAKWFSSRRGIAVGIMGLVTAFGFSYAPRPLQALITRLGWTGALYAEIVLLLLIFLPIVLLFFRSDPESCGMTVEQGLPLRVSKQKPLVQDTTENYTVAEARRQLRFWIMMITLGFWTFFSTAFTFHIVSIYQEIGIGASKAVQIFLPISFISVFAQFIGSYLSDRISIKWLFLSFTLSIMLASASLMGLGTLLGDWTLLIFYGIAGGLFNMLSIVAWPKLYGRTHLGAISGFAMSIMVAGSAIGPWTFSLIYTFTHSYRLVGVFGGVSCLILFIITCTLKFSDPLEKTMEKK